MRKLSVLTFLSVLKTTFPSITTKPTLHNSFTNPFSNPISFRRYYLLPLRYLQRILSEW